MNSENVRLKGNESGRISGFSRIGLLFALSAIFVLPSMALARGGRDVASRTGREVAKESWFQRRFRRPSIEEALSGCKTPEDVCRVVGRYVSYRSEYEDRWIGAEETWKSGRGDCEDLAICVEDLCAQLGFEVSIYVFFPNGDRSDGHAVAVGSWQGSLWMSSNGDYEEVASLDEVARKVAKMLRCEDDGMWKVHMAHSDIQRFVQRDLDV